LAVKYEQTSLFGEINEGNRRVKALLRSADRLDNMHLCKRESTSGVSLKLNTQVLSEGLTPEDAEFLRSEFTDWRCAMAITLRGKASDKLKEIAEGI